MALVRHLRPLEKERNQVHGEVECSYSIFSDGREWIIQLDTYGSPGRALPGKISQTIQFNRESAPLLKKLLERVFPELG